MEKWIRCNIGDVCNTISDTYRGVADEVVLVNTSDVLEGKCLNHQKSPNKNLKGQFKKTFQRDDILYSEIRPANKRFAYIDFDGTDYIASTKLMVIRHNAKILPQFLYYIITSQTIIDELQMLAESRSGTFPQITFSELASLPVELPPLSEQARIIALLKSIDDKIEVNRRINDNLEQQEQALFKSWFVDFEPFKDGEFVESELGMIPKGWRVGNLGGLCITNKRTYRGDFTDKIVYIDTGSVTNNYIESVQELNPLIDKIPSRARRAVTDGDIIFSSVRPNQRHFSLLFNPSVNTVVSTGFIVITANWSGYRFFIYEYLIQDRILDKLQAIAEQSVSTFPSINASDIMNLRLVIPPDNLMRQYARISLSYFSKIYETYEESRRLAQLRDTLLPRLMSGELNINDIEKEMV